MSFVQILIISVTLVVVAVPEGLPLAVTLALAFATKRMTYENLLVRVLASCETMANASVVCTDKTGTLTQNSMSVVAGSIGIHAKFVRQLEKNQERSNVPTVSEHGTADDATTYADEIEDASKGDFAIDTTEINSIISPALQKVISDSVSINSTAFEDRDEKTGKPIFVGSKTETALLKWAKEDLGWADYTIARESAVVVQMIPFSSERKAMGVVVQLSKGKYRFYIKGASEILTQKCTRHVVVQQPGVRSSLSTSATPSPRVSSATRDGDEVETMLINKRGRENISRTIIFYANQTLRTIALCYRDFDSWPPIDTSSYLGSSSAPSSPADDEVPFSVLFKDLTLIGITGIEDPLRPGVREAVLDCQKAGVNVKMCTGDNVLTARSIAVQCGIYTAGGIIMEGPTFRGLNKNDRLDVVRNLQVLARSTPEDKRVLVDTLKELGEIVGVTGDGSNDGPGMLSPFTKSLLASHILYL
jgi:Ca2+-transporting ATPase